MIFAAPSQLEGCDHSYRCQRRDHLVDGLNIIHNGPNGSGNHR